MKVKLMQLSESWNNRIINSLTDQYGIIVNLAVSISHMMFIIWIPYLLLLAIIWSILEVGVVPQDIYEVILNIQDVFESSSYNFWYSSLRSKSLFLATFALWIWFFIVGLVELICHYATGAQDNGKYIVTRSWLRWTTTLLFYFNMTIFALLYVAYISLILVWWILGAILNPQKFLPSAVGSGVFITFWIYIFNRVKRIEAILTESVSKWVDSSLTASLTSAYEKERQKLVDIIVKPIESSVQKLFNQSINAFLKLCNSQTVEKEITDGILEGNAGSIASLFHACLGVEKNIGLCLVGMLLEDKPLILNSIYSLSEEHNLDGNFNVIISEIILNNLGQNNEGVSKVKASIILSMKKLFLKIFPELNSPIIDDILKIVFESDVDHLEEMSKKIHIRSDIFNIVIGIYTENDQKIKDSLLALIRDILPDHFVEIFNAAYDVYQGTEDMYTSLPKILNIEPQIILQLPIAIIKNDKDFIRKSIKEVIKLIIKSTNLDIKYEELEGFLLDIQLLIQGYDKNIDSYISNSLQEIFIL